MVKPKKTPKELLKEGEKLANKTKKMLNIQIQKAGTSLKEIKKR